MRKIHQKNVVLKTVVLFDMYVNAATCTQAYVCTGFPGTGSLGVNIMQLVNCKFGWCAATRCLQIVGVTTSCCLSTCCMVIMHVFLLFRMFLKLCLLELFLVTSPTGLSCVASC